MENSKQIWKITLLYAAFGFAWIYFTDTVVSNMPRQLEDKLQTYKGFFFITATTAFLYMLLNIFRTRLNVTQKTIDRHVGHIEKQEEEQSKLRKLSSELANANAELETFNYAVSHDIKAPLRAIHGYSELLNEKNMERMDDEDKEWVEGIRRGVKNIDTLIDSLLAFSSAGKRQFTAEELDMTKMAEATVAECRILYPDVNYKVTIHSLCNIKADKTFMYQVLGNLIGNAFKYSCKVNTPEITIGCNKEDNTVTYFIKDNGAGFDNELSHKLFKPFQRLHTRRQFEGNGVGLAIVERIITKHKGKVWAESQTDMGATFYFSLPIV
jgi:two-component system sensor histidine kinase/response regulator